MNINEGDTITIGLGSATAHCAIATTTIVAKVDAISDKAVRITAYAPSKNRDYSMWLPKKALDQNKGSKRARTYFEADGADYDEMLRTSFDIKAWFYKKLHGYDAWFFANCSDTLITAA